MSNAREAITTVVTQQGFHAIRGTHARMAYEVVSDLNAEDLSAFVEAMVGSAKKPSR